jgi:hypothetical protein
VARLRALVPDLIDEGESVTRTVSP